MHRPFAWAASFASSLRAAERAGSTIAPIRRDLHEDATMHIVTLVRGDPDEIRHVVRRQIRGELRVWVHIGQARRAIADVRKEHEGVMLAHVK